VFAEVQHEVGGLAASCSRESRSTSCRVVARVALVPVPKVPGPMDLAMTSRLPSERGGVHDVDQFANGALEGQRIPLLAVVQG